MGLGKTYVGSEISTHALTWSATRSANRRTTKIKISTHALTWSATVRWKLTGSEPINFNSRTHVECDPLRGTAGTSKTFQLTHSRGVRRDEMFMKYMNGEISTHALTWSTTNAFKYLWRHEKISTHALTWSTTIDNRASLRIV